MNLTKAQALALLAANEHGILCTLHGDRGVDAVPVVYATDNEGFVGVPVDLVKPKASLRLQRERNLEADPRATLLVEQWNRDDWSQLWWVRTELRWEGKQVGVREETLADELVRRYSQYADRPFARVLVFRIVSVTGWSAQPR